MGWLAIVLALGAPLVFGTHSCSVFCSPQLCSLAVALVHGWGRLCIALVVLQQALLGYSKSLAHTSACLGILHVQGSSNGAFQAMIVLCYMPSLEGYKTT